MSKPDTYKERGDQHDTGFEDYSDKELVHRFRTNGNEQMRQDLSLEMNRRLKQEIEEFSTGSSKQSKIMIRLTWLIAGLTIVMLILGIIQVFILLK